ncbi:MAG TPA: cytochrome c oxidase assembly protein [Polyangiaceae bacterium]|nr:cytochrome c oxidase assembly protein [Polyangiaceae bacterium]
MDTWRLLASCWRPDPLAIGVCLGAAVAAFAPGPRFALRILPFAAALLALVLALASPIGQLADGYLFSAHMLQHLLLVLVVPPLALLGFAPLLSARGAGEGRGLPRLRPLVAWGLGVGAMWLWHEQTLCNAASQSAIVHRVQEVSLLVMGTAFWWPILAPREASRLPPLAGMAYLFTACVACTLLGVLITFSPVEVCSVFAHPVDRLGVMPLVRDGWGLSAERDQQVGGLLMWVPACLVYGAGILGVLGRLLREHPTLDGSVEESKEAAS